MTPGINRNGMIFVYSGKQRVFMMNKKVQIKQIEKESSLKLVYGILGASAILIVFIMLLP